MRTVLVPYKNASKTARMLSRALGIKKIREELVSTVKPGTFVINWGNSRINFNKGLNQGNNVRLAGNKLATFKILEKAGVSIPPFTTSKEKAAEWVKNNQTVLARELLTSHSGKGIHVVVASSDAIPNAPLYVLYKKKKREFRVHVFCGKVLDVQEKRRRNGAKDEEGYNALIRSHDNGWVYCREDVAPPTDLSSLCIHAVNALGLDFGAVDVIYNGHENKYYVLEVNTAPGLEGTTLDNYIQALKGYVK